MKRRFTISKMVLVALLAIIPMTFYGQDNKEEGKNKVKADRYWYIMGDFGAAYYHGDLARYGFAPDFEHTRINGHLGFGYQFGGVIGVNAKLGRGFAEGEKEKHGLILDDLDYFEGNINAYFNLSNLIGGYNPDRLFNFIPHVGVGQMQYKGLTSYYQSGNPYKKYGYKENNTDPNDHNNGGIQDRRVALTVPVGAELNFNLSPKWDVFADYTLNWVDSDRLDDFINGAMQVKNDMYSNINVGVRFKFNKSDNLKSMVDNFDKVTMVVTPEVLEENGNKVPVTIKVTFPEKYFNKKAVMNFTPVLKYANGETQYCTVNFKGEDVEGDGVVINYANGGTYTYTCEVDYNPDMDNSELVVEPVIYAPKTTIHPTKEAALENEKCLTAEERKLADGVIATSNRIGNDVNTLTAPDNYEKVTVLTNAGDIYYQVNMANLNWNLPLNKKSENKAAVAGINDNVKNGWEIKDVTVDGWASPEGEETFNEGLSERRAESAAKFVKDELNKLAKAKDSKVAYKNADDVTFNVKGNGPDWNGFMNAVEASNLKDKKSILNVIRSASADQREQEIRNMILIYPELEEEILPPLRRAVVNVNAFEPKHSDAELSNLAVSDPSSLSCEELLYAATLTDDLNTKATIYANAMKNYPSCANAFINAAQVQIELGNIKDAKELLEKALKTNTKSGELYNNLGAIALIEKDYAKAESYFNQAKALGANVNYNTGILNITKGNYKAAASQMTGTTCTYNLGLAQVLDKNYSAAEQTLNCAEQTAEVFYLKAIIGARTDDASKVYTNLGKAIEKDANYKGVAAADREFIKYVNEPNFQALIK